MIVKPMLTTLWLGLASVSAAMANDLATSITEVTVYNREATVTRSATVNLPAGEQELVLTGMPSNLDPASLRVELVDKRVRLGQVNVRREALRDADSSKIVALQAEIDALTLEQQAIEDSNKVAKLQLSFLDSLASGYSKEAWVGAAQANANTASWQQALSLMESGAGKAYKILRDNLQKKAELAKDLELLQRQLADQRGARKTRTSLLLAVTTEVAINTQIKVHYPQSRAAWTPKYEARLDTASGQLVLAQKAVVAQSTEESWENVKLVLSTSQPSEELEAPTVESHFVNLAAPLAKPQRSRYQEPAPYPADAFLEEVVVTASKSIEPTWSGSYAMNFPIAGRVTVSNAANEEQRYDLKAFSFDTNLVTKIVPQMDDQAYLAARFTHRGSTPLYAAEMLIFVDGVFMGEGGMPDILPGAEVTLPMGQDRQIEVTVSDQGAQDGESGVFKKQRTDAVDLVFEIVNRRTGSALIEVRDAYPVSKNRSIKIDINDNATPPTARDENDQAGVVMWRNDLASGETWKIRYGYSLRYPSDRRLVEEY